MAVKNTGYDVIEYVRTKEGQPFRYGKHDCYTFIRDWALWNGLDCLPAPDYNTRFMSICFAYRHGGSARPTACLDKVLVRAGGFAPGQIVADGMVLGVTGFAGRAWFVQDSGGVLCCPIKFYSAPRWELECRQQ